MADDDLMSEEETVERLRQWWAEYGRLVIAGVVLGIGVLFGGQAWRDHREQRLVEASDLYEQVLDAMIAEDLDTVSELTKRLTAEYAASPYDTHALLALAKVQVARDDLDAAAETIARARESAGDEHLEPVLRIRQARVLLALEQPEAALEALGEKPVSPRFAALHYETAGDALLALGRPEEARTAYLDAQERVETPGAGELIGFKLAALGPPPGAEEVVPAAAEGAATGNAAGTERPMEADAEAPPAPDGPPVGDVPAQTDERPDAPDAGR